MSNSEDVPRSAEEHATCRGCGLILKGKPYYMGGQAYHPRTGARGKVNHYGGFVCSRECDHRSSLQLEQSMPGHGFEQKRLGCYAKESLKRNWPND